MPYRREIEEPQGAFPQDLDPRRTGQQQKEQQVEVERIFANVQDPVEDGAHSAALSGAGKTLAGGNADAGSAGVVPAGVGAELAEHLHAFNKGGVEQNAVDRCLSAGSRSQGGVQARLAGGAGQGEVGLHGEEDGARLNAPVVRSSAATLTSCSRVNIWRMRRGSRLTAGGMLLPVGCAGRVRGRRFPAFWPAGAPAVRSV